MTLEQERTQARKALDNATAGPWADNVFEPYTDVHSYNHLTEEPDGLIANCTYEEDAHLIANAPTWLRNSLDREEQLMAEVQRYKDAFQRIMDIHDDGDFTDIQAARRMYKEAKNALLNQS